MGESWRIRSSTSFPLHQTSLDGTEDFRDVFGGPPTTGSNPFYCNPRVFGDRRRVYEGFYDDIFGSTSARPSTSSDLRPVNIPSQRNGSSTVSKKKQYIRERSDSLPWLRPPSTESHFSQSNLTKNHKSFPFKFSWSDSSPEPISIELNSNSSLKLPVEDIETDSLSSMGSSHCYLDLENKSKFQDKALQEEDEGDTMSSYALEPSCEKWTETGDETVVAINEAIAWAKEKSQRQNTEATGGGGRTGRQTVICTATKSFAEWQARFLTHEHCNQTHEHCNPQGDGYGKAQFHMVNEKLRNWIAEENKPSKAAGCL